MQGLAAFGVCPFFMDASRSKSSKSEAACTTSPIRAGVPPRLSIAYAGGKGPSQATPRPAAAAFELSIKTSRAAAAIECANCVRNQKKAGKSEPRGPLGRFSKMFLVESEATPIETRVCGRGETGRRNGLERNLSALRETGDVELPKVGEPSQVAIPSQARRTNLRREGVETRRGAPKANALRRANVKVKG